MFEKKTFAIIKKSTDFSLELSEKLKEKLLGKGFLEDEENPETVFVVGGDGSLLFAIHKYLEKLGSVKFLGLKSGTLGFLIDYNAEELETLLSDIDEKNFEEETLPLLEISLEKGTFFALNEVRIENLRKVQHLEVSLDGKVFENFAGTGLLVSTPLGSTAYNRSLGGAVLERNLDLLELTEIAGTSFKNFRSLGTSLVLPGETILSLSSENFEEAFLGFDSEIISLRGEKKVVIKKSPDFSATLLRQKGTNFRESLTRLFS